MFTHLVVRFVYRPMIKGEFLHEIGTFLAMDMQKAGHLRALELAIFAQALHSRYWW